MAKKTLIRIEYQVSRKEKELEKKVRKQKQ